MRLWPPASELIWRAGREIQDLRGNFGSYLRVILLMSEKQPAFLQVVSLFCILGLENLHDCSFRVLTLQLCLYFRLLLGLSLIPLSNLSPYRQLPHYRFLSHGRLHPPPRSDDLPG